MMNLRDNLQRAGVARDLAARIVRHNLEVDAPALSWLKVQRTKLGLDPMG